MPNKQEINTNAATDVSALVGVQCKQHLINSIIHTNAE